MQFKRIIFIIFFVFTVVSLFSQNTDIRLLRSINSAETLPSDNLFQFISNSNAYIVIAVPVGMGTCGLIKNDKQLLRNTCTIVAATAFNEVITAAIKYTVNRDRPFITYPDISKKSGAGSPSFPSGHTSSAFATATSLSLIYRKWYITVPSYTWAGSVGYSRMHLGVHYPSDVLAGALIGSGCAWLTYTVNKKLNVKRSKYPDKFYSFFHIKST
jgi:membrane-associated phospholipid phosphatase